MSNNKPFTETIEDIYNAERHITRVPVRIRMHRKRGYNLQQESHGLNGLPAVLCSRSTKFGNPFRVIDGILYLQRKGKFKSNWVRFAPQTGLDTAHAVKWFGICLNSPNNAGIPSDTIKQFEIIKENLHFLKGKNLACFCKENHACHCDTLLKLANL